MHIAWNDVQLLLAVADGGSISAAARALRTTQPTVSRRLAELELDLGEALFQRAVGGTTPTSFGERLLAPARRMAECAAEVGHAAADADRDPRGVVRVSAAPGMAHALLAPFAARLRVTLPEIQLEVVSTVRYVDLVRREADLAIRWQSSSRREAQRDLEVIATAEYPVVAWATPAYIATLPRNYGPADVAWIGWCPPHDHLPPNPQLAAIIPGFRPAFGADDFLLQLRAAECGVGAIVLGRLHRRGGPPSPLVALDLDLRAPPVRDQLVAARGALAIPRIRAVADLLARELTSAGRRRG